MGTLALDSLILCLQVKNWLILGACFLLMILIKVTRQFCAISKMDEIDKRNLSEQTKIRLNKMNEDENCFYQENNQRRSCVKN